MFPIQTTARKSPVKIITTQPSYCPSNEPVSQPFNGNLSGFGNRHCHDDAPFNLWNETDDEFRDPTRGELEWMRQRYQATSVEVAFPHMCIRTLHPPNPIPCTVGAALVRFAPPDIHIDLTPPFTFLTLKDQKRDILSSKLSRFQFPAPSICTEIIKKLSVEAKIQAVHFLPPLIIVELPTGSDYERHSLPGRAGQINIVYHISSKPYWSSPLEKGFSQLLEPKDLVQDDTNYLYVESRILSPGICLASARLDDSGLLTNTWRTTTAGIMLQRGSEKRITVSNSLPDEIYHPTPHDTKIGLISERLPELDIGLVSLAPSIPFSNERYFHAPVPKRIVPHDAISAGNNFQIDAISTGRMDLVVVGKSYYIIDDSVPPNVEYECVDGQSWKIELISSVFGPMGRQVRDGVCGAPFVDAEGRVPGFFRYSDASDLFVTTLALDGLIRRGWVVV